MNRATVALDRITSAVAGLVLLAVGAAAIAWQTGRLPGDREVVDASSLSSASSSSWWLWAVGAVAVVAIVLGLRWLLAHRPRRRAGSAALGGSADSDAGSRIQTGSLTTDLTLAARCAAASMARQPGIVSANGRAVSDRGQRVIEIKAVVDPKAVVREKAAIGANALVGAVAGVPANAGAADNAVADARPDSAASLVADAAASAARELAGALDGASVTTRILLEVSRSRGK